MLDPVTAVRFDRRMATGKTRPCLVSCAREDGSEVELVLKFAAGCESKVRGLITEAVAAMLAADLDLPVPEPFVVRVEADFAATITDRDSRDLAQASLGWNFGSKKLPPGFSTYPKEKPVPQTLIQTAAEILAFDTFIANPDRNVDNANCLFNGRDFAIYDHELAFLTEGIIGWKPPWEPGAVQFPKGLTPKYRHLFQEQLRGVPVNLERLTGAFEAITTERLREFRDALPDDWIGDGRVIDHILDYLSQLKNNLPQAIKNLTGALR